MDVSNEPIVDLRVISFYLIQMQNIPVEKDVNTEGAVPTEWRTTLKIVADAFVSGRAPSGDGIKTVDTETYKINIANIAAYPDALGPLSNKTWQTSVYIWMQDCWEVLIDLSTVNGETSDLVLHARVYSNGNKFEFEPGLIYVP